LAVWHGIPLSTLAALLRSASAFAILCGQEINEP
jgi:hypothetical protein